YALQVLTRLLGSSSTSLLYQKLVVRQKLATSAGGGYSATRRGPSHFYIFASPQLGVSIEKLEKAIDVEIARIVEEGVRKADVEAAKRQLQDLAIFARDSIRSGANAIATSLMIGRTANDVEEWPTRIGKITVEQVNSAARHVLQRQKSVTAVLLPLRADITTKGEASQK
ncbi:MAG: insulinase family protein, partial [Rhodospirillaceae bacterium]|nr:insulinase family protein [Rhodospirillaceae bacterium]